MGNDARPYPLELTRGDRREELVHLRRESVAMTDDYTVIQVRPTRCPGKCCARDRLGTWRPKTDAGVRPAVLPPEVVPVFRAYLGERDRHPEPNPGIADSRPRRGFARAPLATPGGASPNRCRVDGNQNV